MFDSNNEVIKYLYDLGYPFESEISHEYSIYGIYSIYRIYVGNMKVELPIIAGETKEQFETRFNAVMKDKAEAAARFYEGYAKAIRNAFIQS